VPKRTLAVIAFACACCVLFAGTAHLLHCSQHFGHKHKHGKAVPDVVSNTGRVGLRLVDHGNIVHASDANGMLVITEVDPNGRERCLG
jgi:hypothetical protein